MTIYQFRPGSFGAVIGSGNLYCHFKPFFLPPVILPVSFYELKKAATDMMGIISQLVHSDESVPPDVLISIPVSECCGRHTFLKMWLKQAQQTHWTDMS